MSIQDMESYNSEVVTLQQFAMGRFPISTIKLKILVVKNLNRNLLCKKLALID